MPPVVPAEYTVYRTRVSTIMNGLGATASASDKAYAAAHVIVNVELDQGSRFLIVDGVPHLFSVFGRRLLPIDLNNGRWSAHLLMVYGIIAKDREIAPRVTSVINSYALCNGMKMSPRRWSAYVPGDALYLSQYDGTVRRITGAGVEEGPNYFLVDDASPIYRGDNPPPLAAPISFEIEDNGTHVLFADDDAGSVPADPPIGRNGELFKLLRGISWATETLSGMRPKHQVQAMMIWMLALAFPDVFPTKPVLMVEGPPGSGKCLGAGTPVLKFDGTIVPVETIKIGDVLMGPDSRPRRVLGTTVGTGPLYRVQPTQGDAWVCNDAHQLTLVNTDTDKIIDIEAASFASASTNFRARHKQFMTGVDFPPAAPLPVDPYFVGLWFGDGTKTDRDGKLDCVRITSADAEIEAAIRATAAAWGADVRQIHKRGCSTWCISYGTRRRGVANPLLDAIRALAGDSSTLPRSYLTADRSTRVQLLAGLLDTDGHLDRGCFEITQKRRGIADDVCFLARSLGLRAVLAPKHVRGFNEPYWRIVISGNIHHIPTRILRKRAAPRRQIKDVARTGITLEPIGVGAYYGFQVDGDGRFLLGDFTVTHNSTVLQLIQQALFGEVQPFTVSEDGLRDFWVAMLQSPIMVLDNTDDVIKWLPDQINAYVTRGYRKERRLHTNTGTVEIRPHSFIAVASQDPRSFRRGDTADRMIVLRMAERFGPGRRGGDSIAYLTARVAQQRARMYGEWVYYLNRVVAALQREPIRHTTARLGDFEVFAYAACRALGWQSTLVVPALMATLGRERATFAAETDIVLDVVTDWLAFPGNAGRPLSIRQMFIELSNLAATNSKPFVKTPQALAQRLQAPHVKLGCHVHSFIQGDHRMYQLYQPLGDGN